MTEKWCMYCKYYLWELNDSKAYCKKHECCIDHKDTCNDFKCKQFIIQEYPDYIIDTVNNKEYPMSSYYPHIEGICELLNNLSDEKKQLQEKLKIYHEIANCKNCNYHDYDWFDDGSYDEFEVCRKGNDVTEGICKEWREL